MSSYKVHNTHAHTVTTIRQVRANVTSERRSSQHRRQPQIGIRALSCPAPCDLTDWTSPGSSLHGILQAGTLEWIAISFSRESSQPRDGTWVSCSGRRTLYHLSHQGSPRADGWKGGGGAGLKTFRRNCECKTISVMILRQHVPFILCSTRTDGVNATVVNDCRGNQGRGTRLHSWLLCTYSQKKTVSLRMLMKQEFPGGAVVRILHFQCRDTGSVPGLGIKIPHATCHNRNLKTKK